MTDSSRRELEEMEYVTKEVHKEFAERIEAEDNRQNKRLEKLEESMAMIQSLTVSVEKMAMSIESLTKEVSKQGEKLAEIEGKPAKNWDKLVWAIGGAVLTAIIAMILKQVGLG